MMACMSYHYNHFLKTGQIVSNLSYQETKEYKKLYAKNDTHAVGLRLAAAKSYREKQEDKKHQAEQVKKAQAQS